MKKPRFKVLADLALRREDEARRLVGQRERERAERAEQVEALELARRAAAPETLALRDLYATWWRAQEELIRAAHAQLAAADAALEKARADLREARRTTLTWAKLRERDAEAIRIELERKQAREIDDLAATRSDYR